MYYRSVINLVKVDMSNNNSSNEYIATLRYASVTLGIVFIVLKLVGVINWSWWWVTLPFWWGLPAFVVIVILIALLQAWAYHYNQLTRK